MNRTEPPASGIWDSLLDGLSPSSRGKPESSRDTPLPARFSVSHLLMIVMLASLFCMAARSLLTLDPLGILIWPVLLGFGTERMVGGHGVMGGTIGGVLSFAISSWIASTTPGLGAYWSDPRFLALSVLSIGAGVGWGFYLSVWVYILVETARQYF